MWLLNYEASFKTVLINETTVSTCVIPYNAVPIGSYALRHVRSMP